MIQILVSRILIVLASEEESEQAPLLFIDVNIGEGKKPRITLYNGDNPEVVASKFSREHRNIELLRFRLG